MDNEYIDLIQPLEIKTIAVKFIPKVQSIILGKSAIITVALFDANTKIVGNRIYQLIDESYTNWGSSDAYISDYVQEQLAKE